MYEPKISVIMPVYNAWATLRNMLESLLAQSYRNLEIIVVDDGSTDSSGELCDAFAVKYENITVFHKENGGAASARNYGIEKASGEYLLFVDCDDTVTEDYCETFIQMLDKYKGFGSYWCALRTVSDLQLSDSVTHSYCDTELYSESGAYEIGTLHSKWLDCSPCNKLYRRDVIMKNGLRMDEKFPIGEDVQFNFAYLDALDDKRIVICNRPTYNYIRSNSESLDSRYRANAFELYKAMHKNLFDYLVKWNSDETQKKLMRNAAFFKYESTLRSNFSSSCPNSKRESYRMNAEIMADAEFRSALEATADTLNPYYVKAYKRKSYFWVRTIDKILALRRKMKGAKR